VVEAPAEAVVDETKLGIFIPEHMTLKNDGPEFTLPDGSTLYGSSCAYQGRFDAGAESGFVIERDGFRSMVDAVRTVEAVLGGLLRLDPQRAVEPRLP